MDHKRKESAQAELSQCTFAPKREASAISDMYLKRAGRKKLNPDDLFKYEDDRRKRLEIRKAIVQEIQSKELTFKPQLGEKTLKLQEKLTSRGQLKVDPVTRTVVTSPHTLKYRPKGLTDSHETHYEHGPILTIESEHPYRNNTSEYTTVHIPHAVQYIVSFDAETRTEGVYDFVRFYADETHTDYYGANKYSGM
ncbi:hypothetical protein EON63_23200 [archaeon]|nr:MAG: hypothetical protein EON63_23200 [archaeon]